MRTALLLVVSLFFLTLIPSFSQVAGYQRVLTIGGAPTMNIHTMAIDNEDNLYLTDMSRVVKVKNGKTLLDFNVNKSEYSDGWNNTGAVYIDLVVDRKQFIYILNQKKKRVEKHDQQGKLIKVFQPIVDDPNNTYYTTSIYLDYNDNINVFNSYNRSISVYNSEGILLETVILDDPDPALNDPNPAVKFGNPRIAFDSNNNIYVTESKLTFLGSVPYLTYFNREGKIIKRFSSDLLIQHGITKHHIFHINIDKNGDLYVYNFNAPVSVFSPDGSFKKTIFIKPNTGNRILFDSQNHIYVAQDGFTADYVLKIDQEQKVIEQIGNVRRPYEAAFDKDDNLYVLDHVKLNLIKYNAVGEEYSDFKLDVDLLVNPLSLTIDNEGSIYILEYSGSGASNTSARVRKYNSLGKSEGIQFNYDVSYKGQNDNYISAGLAVDHEGNIYVTNPDPLDSHSILRYNSKSKSISKFGPVGKGPGEVNRPLDVTVDAIGNIYVLDMNGNRIQKFSASGKYIQQYGSYNVNELNHFIRATITSDAFGNILVSTPVSSIGPSVQYYDLTGKLKFSLPLDVPCVAMNKSGNRFATTEIKKDAVTLYEAALLQEYNFINGNIYHDKNSNCVEEATDVRLADVLVKAEPGPYYGVTDALGNYNVIVGKGVFKVEPISENAVGRQITPTCELIDTIVFDSYGNYSTGNNIGADVTLSPYLTTSVSSTRRRRCFESTTKLTYSNSGFAPAENAKVYLQLPKEVELLSADKTYTRLPNGTYVFNVGTVAAGETKVITIQDKVTCGDESVRGLTVCTRAWITHGTPATPKVPVVTITGKCNPATGEVRFVIRNNGAEAMETGELFRIYRNGQLSTIEQYKLAAGDSLVLWIPAGGKTIRLEADQPDGNGDNTLASATIEGCKISANTVAVSTGFVNILPQDDEEPEVSVECLPIIDSFDPNDKQVTPAGLTEEKYTPTGRELKYKIRFQNTGTDVAYRVVVVDTLSEHLDLSTLQIGSASHNYRFDVSGKGKPVLTWTFDNIMLPDSTSNEPGSHGYIQFSIKPKADLPEKTLVENLADIFFDYNSPVRTNITANRIYDMPDVISEADKLDAEELIATPGITAFAPESGKFGEEVILTGKKFSTEAAQNKVYFNGLAATIVSATENELKVLVPANATTGSIKVQTQDGAAQSITQFEVYQPPVITSFSPAEGIVGNSIILQGKHLTPEWLQSINIGNHPCEIISLNGTSTQIKLTGGAVTGTFEVVTKGGEAKAANAFVVWHQPIITSLSHTLDKVGATITIQGSNFAADKARNNVMFGDVPAQILEATTSTLKVKVPAGAQSNFVTIKTPGGEAVSPVIFEVIPAPVVTAFMPAIGTVGMEVELTGAHFVTLGKQDTITFNGQKADLLEASPTKLKVRVPRGATSGKITVSGIGGQAITASDFILEELTPEQAIEVYPNPTTGNFTIRFMHADFEVQQVQLFSALGQLVYSEKVASPRPDKLDIKLIKPKAGIYILHIKTERGLVVKKLNIL